LSVCISWVDDCLKAGNKQDVLESKKKIMESLACDDQGEMEEYIGCKVERNDEEGYIRFTQPVMLQSFEDEFDMPKNGGGTVLPATAGEVLAKEEDDMCTPDEHSKYRTGVGKMLHMMKWSRPEILNRVRELSRYVQYPSRNHLKAMYKVMRYCLGTKKRGLTFKPSRKWDGKDREFEFIIRGKSDSDFAKDTTKRSISGWSVFLEDSPVAMKSKMQGKAAVSVTEAEAIAATECAQDMVFTMHVMESIGLKVKKPMILEVDNKGAVDLANNWSSAGRTRHIAPKITFLRELKEEGVLKVKWTSNDNMSSDIFTKNVGGTDFKKHMKAYVGEDEYT
jgi:hypothetical protein